MEEIYNYNVPEITATHPYLSTCTDVAEISKPLERLGITYFSYSRVEKTGGRIYTLNTPAMLDLYFKGKYYLVGKMEGYPELYKPQIVMWDTLPSQIITDNILRPLNIDHGMYMIEPHADYCDFFGFATKKGNSSIINTYLSQLEYLKSFANYFKERAVNIIRKVDEKKIILPFNRDIIDFTNCQQTEGSVAINSDEYRAIFSARQLEVAKILLQGKATKDIANELKLSPRTIEMHINLLKAKLKCHKLSELILKLTRIIT